MRTAPLVVVVERSASSYPPLFMVSPFLFFCFALQRLAVSKMLYVAFILSDCHTFYLAGR